MSYHNFCSEFQKESSTSFKGVNLTELDSVKSVSDLSNILGDKTFANGAYRIFSRKYSLLITHLIESYFVKYANKIDVFGGTWLGLIVAINKEKPDQVLLFEPETGDVFEVPGNLEQFHSFQLIENREPILREELYGDWLKYNPGPNISECVGFKKPLFLGGLDNVDNLEISNTEVYLSVSGQLWHAVKNLPSGTKLGNVSIG